MAVGLLDRRADRGAHVREEQRRLDVGGELAQVRVAPRGRDGVVDARAVAGAVPAQAEAVAVGRLGAHARVQALVDDPVLRLEQQLVDQHRLSEPSHPATHGSAPYLSVGDERGRDDVGGRGAPAGGQVEARPGRAAGAAEQGVGALGDVGERLRAVLRERGEQRRDEPGLAAGPGCGPAGSRGRSCRRRAASRRSCRRRRRCSGPSRCSSGRPWSRRSGSPGSRRRRRRCRGPCACSSS